MPRVPQAGGARRTARLRRARRRRRLAAQAPPSVASSAKAPAGACALTRWTLRSTPATAGSRAAGSAAPSPERSVSVPNVVDPIHIKGRAGQRNYEGSVAWYRTSITAPAAGAVRAQPSSSANFKAPRTSTASAIVSHRGSYLPFEGRATLHAGPHTLVVRIDWRNPGAQSKTGLSPHVVQLGRARRRGDDAADRRERAAVSRRSRRRLQPRPGRPAGDREGSACSVHNNGPRPRARATGDAVQRPRAASPSQFPGADASAHGQTAADSATVDRAQPRAVVAGPAPASTQLALSIAGESSYSARVGLRQLTLARRAHLFLNGRAAAPAWRSHPGGRAWPRRRADAGRPGRIVGELRAIGANAVRAQHPLDPALLERLDAAGIARLAGRRPRRRRRQLVLDDAHAAGGSRAAGAHGRARRRSCIRRSSPGTSSTRSPQRPRRRRGQLRADADHVAAPARSRRAWSPSTCGAITRRSTRARCIAASTRSPRPTTPAGTTRRRTPPAQQKATMRARLRAQERTFAGKVLMISEFGAESNTLNPPGSPGSYSFQSSLLRAPHRRLRGRSQAQRRCSSGSCATTRSCPPSKAARSIQAASSCG